MRGFCGCLDAAEPASLGRSGGKIGVLGQGTAKGKGLLKVSLLWEGELGKMSEKRVRAVVISLPGSLRISSVGD